MIDVYYPYLHNESKWNELKYSLRSIDKHLKEDYRVVIVGDCPDWVKNVTHIPHTRNHHIEETSTFDAVSKLILYLNHESSSEYFIRMYDDIYLLQDVTISDIDVIRAMYDINGFPADGKSVWFEQLKRTMLILKKNGLTTWNTETHMPEYFKKNNMLSIIDVFKPLENRLLTSTLYFNVLYSYLGLEPIIEKRTHGAKFYGDKREWNYPPEADPAECCVGKLFLNHNNAGLTDKLKAFIEHKFPEKSRFEK
jgi:hypothetical protein